MSNTRAIATPDMTVTEYDPIRYAKQAAEHGRSIFEELAAEAIVTGGTDLITSEFINYLVGIDMVIVKVSFRRGISDNTGYASLEAVVNPELSLRAINMARAANGLESLTSLDDLPFEPGTMIVWNDGSTGVYRDMVRYLYLTGYIGLAEPVVWGGPRGECSFDTVPADWTIKDGLATVRPDGWVDYEAPVRIRARKGLRISEYEGPNGKPVRTHYLA